MGWTTDDGLHEGLLVPEFRDGRRGISSMGGDVPLDEVIVEADYFVEPPGLKARSAADVVGWRIVCAASGSDRGAPPSGGEHWHSALLPRVAFRRQEDVADGRLWAADDAATFVGKRADVDELARSIWREQHVQPDDALRILQDARTRAALANRDLERAVARALDVGIDARAIERAVGFYPLVRTPHATPAATMPRRVPGLPRQRSGPSL
jgi:hypothetical protein